MNVKRAFLVSLVLVFFGIAFVPLRVAAQVVDQQQPIIDLTVGGLAISAGFTGQLLAQVVTAGMSGTLTEVRFPVACGSGDLVVEIHGETAGLPDSFVLASVTVPGSTLPSVYPAPPIFRSLTFSDPLSLTAGERFAIVLRSTGFCGLFQGPLGDPYVGGDGFYSSPEWPTWNPLSAARPEIRKDLPFQTVVAPLVIVPVAIAVKPGSTETPRINPGARGVIPVAIATSAAFDATTLDLDTARLGPASASPLRTSVEDVDGDGDLDLVLDFENRDTGIACGDTSVTIRGFLQDGRRFEGTGPIITTPCR